MMIADRPPGLTSRRMFPIDRGRVVVEERWDIDTPGCPMIRNPWLPSLAVSGSLYVRQREMTAEEFERSGIPLF
jgi:hypothetical protein